MVEPGLLLGLGLLLVALVLLLGLISRQRQLTHRVGAFGCRYVADPETPLLAVPGVAGYGTGRLDWWRLVSLSARPARTWSRDRLKVVGSQELGDVDDRGRPLLVVRCRHDTEEFALTMTTQAYAGLVSWLEARPRRARAF